MPTRQRRPVELCQLLSWPGKYKIGGVAGVNTYNCLFAAPPGIVESVIPARLHGMSDNRGAIGNEGQDYSAGEIHQHVPSEAPVAGGVIVGLRCFLLPLFLGDW
jgi:hypothetical protein